MGKKMQSHFVPKKRMMRKCSKDVGSNLPDHDNRPTFTKLILHDGDASRSLEIPRDFVRSHLPNRMPCRAVLKVPCGDSWNITLLKQDTSIIMQQGWQQFYQHYSLGGMQFLLFCYNDDMCFDVHIFDKDGCEKKYVSVSGMNQDMSPEIKEEDTEMIDTVESKLSQAQNGRKATRVSAEEMYSSSSSFRTQPASRKGRGKLCKAAEDFTSNFPQFKHCLTKSNLGTQFHLTTPLSFSKVHLPPDRTEFTFCTSKGKSWKVNMVCTGANRVFSRGWRSFAVDNKLEIGDCCVFELLASRLIRVHIFPH